MNAEKEGSKKGGMHERRGLGLEGYINRGIQDWRDTEKEGSGKDFKDTEQERCWTGEIHESWDAGRRDAGRRDAGKERFRKERIRKGLEGCNTGEMLDRRDT